MQKKKNYCDDHSSLSSTTAVQYEFHIYIYFTSFHCRGRYELNELTSLLMCGFTAQLVEHRTGIAEVTGSNPVEALIFFGLLPSNCLKKKNYILHFHLQSQYNMNFIYIPLKNLLRELYFSPNFFVGLIFFIFIDNQVCNDDFSLPGTYTLMSL